MADDTSKNKKKKSPPAEVEPAKEKPAKEKSDDGFLTVGLGASAGGIQALKEFFTNVPKDSGIAYVVILHMSPEHESKLAEILQVVSAIPVTQVRERVKVQPNHVYVIPPSHNLAMTDGHLVLTHMIGAEERRSPVDLFFRTLAEANEDRGVSVILSGTGADGSMGIKRLKEYGGVAFVQDPAEAEYKDMPRNAIATGIVDHVLKVAEIPGKIISYKDHLGTIQIPKAVEVLHTDEAVLVDIFTQLRVRTGHDFSNYKRATILRRIERRMGLRELSGLSAYARYMRERPEEVQMLMKELLISVTNFFRDAEAVEAMARKVFPKLFERQDPDKPVRVWVAGCATGEEAYSVAMLLSEYAEDQGNPRTFQIFATDLDQESIQLAREGFYKEAEVADVSPLRLRRFFTREAEGYRVKRELKESILFAAHNAIKDPPFSHLDLISCRNLLIYLNRTAQGRILEIFHFALNSGGHLFLGASESIEGAGDLFVSVDKEHHIYQSRPVPTRAFQIPEITLRPSALTRSGKEKTSQETRAIERMSYADLHLRLLENYGPPSVVVNESYDILHLSERAGRYMLLEGGEPSNNLLKLIRPELRVELRAALYEATNDRVNVEARGLRVKVDGPTQMINILVRPVLREGDATRGFILVLFEDQKVEPSEVSEPTRRTSEPITNRLEKELVHSKAQLRATVEQYEIQQEELRASNEELQAMNEELRSSAEELETSKEELQSVNEEMTTVNQELKIKIEELSQANNNFKNLMNSTDVGTIFLDRSLRIRLFTPRARDVFNVIETDIGRSLLDITSQVSRKNLVADVEEVLNRLQPIQRELETASGGWYLMRISPYRTADDHIEGVVITLVDISKRRQQEVELRAARDELEHRVSERTEELQKTNEALRAENVRRKKIEDERLRLVTAIVSTQEDERRRISRDLHDQMGQQLTALRLKLEALKEKSPSGPSLAAKVDNLQALVTQLDSDVDFLAWQLRPFALDDIGLSAALSNYVNRWSEHFGIAAEFRAGELVDQRFDPRIETNLYRIAQEALTNCAKHSNCSRVDVLLERRDQNAVLIIEDNGVGFDPQTKAEGDRQWGLIGMRERATLLNGTLEIESAPNNGTTLFVKVPLTLNRQ